MFGLKDAQGPLFVDFDTARQSMVADVGKMLVRAFSVSLRSRRSMTAAWTELAHLPVHHELAGRQQAMRMACAQPGSPTFTDPTVLLARHVFGTQPRRQLPLFL